MQKALRQERQNGRHQRQKALDQERLKGRNRMGKARDKVHSLTADLTTCKVCYFISSHESRGTWKLTAKQLPDCFQIGLHCLTVQGVQLCIVHNHCCTAHLANSSSVMHIASKLVVLFGHVKHAFDKPSERLSALMKRQTSSVCYMCMHTCHHCTFPLCPLSWLGSWYITNPARP